MIVDSHAHVDEVPALGWMDLVDRAFAEFGMRGVKLHPVGNLSHPASEVSLRVIRRAAEHRAPVLFHCGDEALTTPLQIALAAEASSSICWTVSWSAALCWTRSRGSAPGRSSRA